MKVTKKTASAATKTTKTPTKPVAAPAKTKAPPPAAPKKAAPAPVEKAKAAPVESAYEIPDYSEGIELAEGSKPTFDPAGNLCTPVGTAVWAWVGKKADDKFDADKPKQKITVVFNSEDPELEGFFNRILAFENAYRVAIGEDETDSLSIIKEADESFATKYQEATGLEEAPAGPFMVITRGAKPDPNGEPGDVIPVPLFDEDGPLENGSVYSGDQVRVEFSLGGYNSPNKKIGAGIKSYLQGIQIVDACSVKRTEGGGKAGSTFKFSGKKAASTKAAKPTKEADDEVPESDDDIPF